MARTPSPAVRTTVYRLVGLDNLADAVRPRYLDSDAFTRSDVEMDGCPAVLVVGSMISEEAAWAPRVEALTGTPVVVGNHTAAGVLVIRVDGDDDINEAWALTYGMGFQMLDANHVDPAFGQRIALRAADPDELRSLTRTTLDYRARTDRSSIPSGEPLRSYGLGDFGEIVSRVVGPARIPDLTVAKQAVAIRGADALSVPLGRTPTSVVADLRVLQRVLSQEALPELQALEHLTPVKSPDVVTELEGRLVEALGREDASRLALGWPNERIDESATPSSFRIVGAPRGGAGPFDDTPTLDVIRATLVARSPGDLLSAANSVKVQLYRDADAQEAMSSAIPVMKWLAFETDWEGRRYSLHDGRWYLMDQDYAVRLTARVEQIFARACPVSLPDWVSDYAKEEDYNVAAGKALGAAVLDRKLIQTQLHRRGIEPCDLIAGDGLPIHVKNVERSTAASHLFAQALVATDALRFDEEARRKVRERIKDAGGSPDWLPDRLEGVVLGIARPKTLTAADLFTFSQVTLARLDAQLANVGVTVYVAPILRHAS